MYIGLIFLEKDKVRTQLCSLKPRQKISTPRNFGGLKVSIFACLVCSPSVFLYFKCRLSLFALRLCVFGNLRIFIRKVIEIVLMLES